MPMGSRLLTGNTPLHESLEERLARFCQKPAALLFNYGYLGVLGTMAALAQKNDLVIIDSLSHASIVDGALLASAGRPFRVFRHNDMDSLEAQLRTAREENTGGILVVTEGVFGMSGDLAPLASRVPPVATVRRPAAGGRRSRVRRDGLRGARDRRALRGAG